MNDADDACGIRITPRARNDSFNGLNPIIGLTVEGVPCQMSPLIKAPAPFQNMGHPFEVNGGNLRTTASAASSLFGLFRAWKPCGDAWSWSVTAGALRRFNSAVMRSRDKPLSAR